MEKKEKSIVEKVTALLFSSEETFAEVKTSEGIILNVSAMEVDGVVEVVSEDGKELASAGDYILEDGSTIVVGEAGVISDIKPMEEEVAEEEMAEEPLEEAKEVSNEDTTEEEVNPLEARIQALEAKFNEVVIVNDKIKAANVVLAEANEALESKFSAFKGEPAAEEIKISKSDSKTEKFKKLGNIRRNK